MRLKLTIEYAGTRYSGWQIQKNARTIQGELERAIREVTGVDAFELYGSGRTDAGVHALAQAAHLDIQSTLPADTLRRRVNDALPTDIVIVRAERVPHRFHARRDALARSYLYQVTRRRTAFAKPFVWWVKEDLSVEAMRDAAKAFVGFHDFRAFSDDDPTEKSTEVLVDGLEIYEDEDLILFHMEGSHFIWKMVRRMVGVLVEVSKGEIDPDDVWRVDAARLTAPAAGLFLERVFYDGDRRQWPLLPAMPVGPARD